MPPLPWCQREAIVATRDYVAMVSRLPLRRYRSIPGFLRDTLAIRRHLADAPGLVGYTFSAQLLRKTFGTFSVWTDEDSLRAFATSQPHRRIVGRLRPRIDASIFRTVPITGTELPLSWPQIKDLIKEKETSS